MSKERFEFKILKDKDGEDTDLTKLSLSESKAFLILLDSMISLAESTGLNKDDFEIKIEKGSACVAIESLNLNPLINEYQDVLSNNSNNSDAVQAFRNVQNLFLSNGLTYSSQIKTINASNDVFNEIYKAKTFRTKSIKRSKEFEISFLKGHLQEIGGKNPNFHIVSNSKTLKIECIQREAHVIKNKLYEEIMLSVIKTKFKNGKSTYKFVDYYSNEDDFKLFKTLINEGYESKHLDYLRQINRIIKEAIKSDDFIRARQILKLFNNDFTDESIQKTILIITKAFIDHNNIKHIRKSIKSILERKRGEALV